MNLTIPTESCVRLSKCNHLTTTDSPFGPCPVCAEIKARGEEVLEMVCGTIEEYRGTTIGVEIITEEIIDYINQDYCEKYGDTPASIFGPDGRGVATGANLGEKGD